MIPEEQYRIDPVRAAKLAPIREKMKLTAPQMFDRALDEFIAEHGIVTKPEPVKESQKDKDCHQRIAELSRDMRIAPGLIRREILNLSVFEITQKYAIHQTEIPVFQDYIRRTNQK
jgi:hypothetical protein